MIDLSRRQFAGSGLAAGLLTPRLSCAQSPPLARVIVDNDLAGDPDGLVALAYQAAAPTTRTVLVTTSALDPHLASLTGTAATGRTAAWGAKLAADLIGWLESDHPPAIVAGSEMFGSSPATVSRAAHAIVAEARRPDPLPLFVTCGGPLTNIAAALRVDPSIARRMTVIWIGGRSAPAGGDEYNLATDPAAARQVLEASDVPFWQVPIEAYESILLSQAELAADLKPISPLTAWLYDRLADLPAFVPPSGFKGLGDCALVPLTAISGDAGRHRDQPARHIRDDLRFGEAVPGRTIRVYESMDLRLLTADMLATFRLEQRRRRA